MRTLVNEPPPLLQEWLDRRRSLGQDLYDEIWEGVYHVAPAPRQAHARLDDQISRVLGPFADRAGLYGNGALNLGRPDDYRVPDRAYTRSEGPATFLDTVAIVVEILSPNDETWDKFDFYFRHGVDEVLVADPTERRVTWHLRGDDRFEERSESRLLALTATELAEGITWPPLA